MVYGVWCMVYGEGDDEDEDVGCMVYGEGGKMMVYGV